MNIPALLHATKIIAREKKVSLILAGDGPIRGELKKTCMDLQLENVHFLGVRSDVPEILSGLDIYVQPSWYEGFSNAVLEAMATVILRNNLTRIGHFSSN